MLYIYERDTLKDVEFLLQGGVTGGRVTVNQRGTTPGLSGTTLIFLSPAVTVTFSDTSGVGLNPQDIVNQIVAVNSTIVPFWRGGCLNLLLTPAAASNVAVSHAGTANPIFGFSSATDNVGVFYAGPTGLIPRLVPVDPKARLDGYYVVVER